MPSMQSPSSDLRFSYIERINISLLALITVAFGFVTMTYESEPMNLNVRSRQGLYDTFQCQRRRVAFPSMCTR